MWNQQDGVGEFGAVAVVRVDRCWEPDELASGTTRPADPQAVTPIEALIFERSVVLASAGWTTSAHLGNMDLIDALEAVCCMPSEDSRESRAEPSAGQHRRSSFLSETVEPEESLDVVEIVRDRNHMNTAFNSLGGMPDMLASGRAQDEEVHIGNADPPTIGFDPFAESGYGSSFNAGPDVANDDGIDGWQLLEVVRNSSAHRASPEDSDSHPIFGRVPKDFAIRPIVEGLRLNP